jgi:colanic acid/amylovoran biosynthesis protein
MANKPIKVCILGAAFNTDNMGVSVLAAGALRCVLNMFPHAQIIQMDYGRKGYGFEFGYDGRRVPVRCVNIRFSKQLYLDNHIVLLVLLALLWKLLPLPIVRKRLCFNSWLKEMFDTDLVVSLAAGDSFSDTYGFLRLLYISLPQILAVLVGKRLILLPQTIGPFHHRVSKALARYILTRADVIYSRDHSGQTSTERFLGLTKGDRKVRFCYDLGFDVDTPNTSAATIVGLAAERHRHSPLIGVNVSGLLMMGGYSRNNMFGLTADYSKLVFRLIDYFVATQCATVVLIPHVMGDSGESDVCACEAVFERMQSRYAGTVGIVRNATDYGDVKALIGQCDFFIGARMHACIGALSQHVPAVSMAYSDKFMGVMETLELPDLVVDPRTMNEDEIVQSVDRVFTRRLELRCALEQRMPLVKQTIRRLLIDLDVPDDDEVGTSDTSRIMEAPCAHARGGAD